MRTIRWPGLQKLSEFSRNGGLVLILGSAPEASERVGRNDPVLDSLVRKILEENGHFSSPEEVCAKIRGAFPPDLQGEGHPYFLHRRVDGLDVYFLYGAKEGSEYRFRAKGRVHLFDPRTGAERELPVLKQEENGTLLRIPLAETEAQVIVFDAAGVPMTESGLPAPAEEELRLGGPWRFRLLPTLDNVWGDFRQPPTNAMIGAEGRIFRFEQGGRRKKVVCSFGTCFLRLGPMPEPADEALLALPAVREGTQVSAGGRKYAFAPYLASRRYGIPGDPGPQGSYHGLKGKISNEFIAFGRKVVTQVNSNSRYDPEPEGNYYYLYTTVFCEKPTHVFLKYGTLKPAKVYCGGKPVSGGELELPAGVSRFLLRFDSAGRTYFIVDRRRETPKQTYPLAMDWYADETVLPFDPYPEESAQRCRFSITAPPAARSMELTAFGREISVFSDGRPVPCERTGTAFDGAGEYRVTLNRSAPGTQEIRVELLPENGVTEAALSEPARFSCGEGEVLPGDWAENESLLTYSGGARYRRTVFLRKTEDAVLDLGRVGCSAEAFVNGKSAGVRFAPPYRFAVGPLLREGENEICVEVFNTLYNNYLTIPTGYNTRPQESGLLETPVIRRKATG
jgi:hypothetical protein